MDFVDCQVQGVALQAIAELPGEKLTSPELLALKAQAQPTGQLANWQLRRKLPEILKADCERLSSYRILEHLPM